MTITQTVEIPADRWLRIKVPNEIPEGKAEFEFKIIPFVKKDENPADNGKIHLTKEMVDEMLADETLLSLTGILKTDMTPDEIRMARLAKHL